ncbi:MAG TPA: carbohydrate-binding domain-containing protein [Myxococcaceae bacterium]
MRPYWAVLVVLALAACAKGDKGDRGDPGPLPEVAPNGGITGSGATGSPLAVDFGTTGTTAARGNHNHDFSTLGNIPPVLVTPIPNGIESALVESVRVNAFADCGTVIPAPHMEVFVNGSLIGEADVTSASPMDFTFAVSPRRYTSEVAVAFSNHNNSGGCDHKLHVVSMTVVTPGGPWTLRANDRAHAFLDKASNTSTPDRALYFDGVDVDNATQDFAGNGALRYFLSPPSSRQGTPIAIQATTAARALPIGNTLVATQSINGPAQVAVTWSALASNSGAGGGTFSRIVLDSNTVTSQIGFRNGTDTPTWFPQHNSWVGIVGPGQHSIDVIENVDVATGNLNAGDLTILVWPY